MLQGEWHRDFSGSPEILDRAFALAKRGVELADNESTSPHGAESRSTWSGDRSIWRCDTWSAPSRSTPPTRGPKPISASFSPISAAPKKGSSGCASARRADPYFGPSWYWPSVGLAQFVLRRYADALADFDRGATGLAEVEQRTSRHLAMMAGCCAKLGLADRARELVARCLAGSPRGHHRQACGQDRFQECERQRASRRMPVAGMPE